jgi:hypothetical protein
MKNPSAIERSVECFHRPYRDFHGPAKTDRWKQEAVLRYCVECDRTALRHLSDYVDLSSRQHLSRKLTSGHVDGGWRIPMTLEPPSLAS